MRVALGEISCTNHGLRAIQGEQPFRCWSSIYVSTNLFLIFFMMIYNLFFLMLFSFSFYFVSLDSQNQ